MIAEKRKVFFSFLVFFFCFPGVEPAFMVCR